MTRPATPTKHTPGPWKVVRRDSLDGFEIQAKEEDGITVFPASINGDPDNETYGPRTLANARLIAAAPALLETVEMLWARIQSNPRVAGMLHIEDYSETVPAIIRQAKGEK